MERTSGGVAEVLVVLVLAAGAASATDERTGEYSRSERRYSLPDVTLVDRSDKPVQLKALLEADEPVMLNFIFTRCRGICPVTSTIFSKVSGELGPDAARLRLISISIDPETDTPKRLDAYASKFGAGPRWTFLTGSAEDIVAIQRAFDTWRPDKMSHVPLTFFRARKGDSWIRLEGFASPRDLAQEYRRAVNP